MTDKGFASYFDSLGSSRIVLLGDASHGTSEFYHTRTETHKTTGRAPWIQHHYLGGRLAGRGIY